MYNIKILEEAYTAVIELTDNCASTDKDTLSNLYHLMRLVLSSIRDFPQDAEQLEKMKDMLDVYSAKLKRRIGKNLSQYYIEETIYNCGVKKNRLYSHLTNAHCALTWFIREKAEKKEVGDFLRIYKIADLYIQHLFEYSDKIRASSGIENLSVINSTLYVFILDIGHHAGYLEKAMRTEGIKFDEIKV